MRLSGISIVTRLIRLLLSLISLIISLIIGVSRIIEIKTVLLKRTRGKKKKASSIGSIIKLTIKTKTIIS